MKGFRGFLAESSGDKVLIIMRGIPGSGKSYWAHRYAGEPERVFAPDDWPGYGATLEDYKQNWTPEGAREAHAWTYGRLAAAMAEGVTPVVMDSTNLTKDRAAPYVALAVRNGYRVEVKESQSEWWQRLRPMLKNKAQHREALSQAADQFAGKNVHGVTADKIMGMLDSWEEFTADDLAREAVKDTIPYFSKPA